MTAEQNPSNTTYARVFRSIERRRWLCLTIVIAAACLCLWLTTRLRFDNQIETVLPGNTEILQTIEFLRESNLSDTIMVSLGLTSDNHTLQDLIRAADAYCADLKSPLIERIERGVPQGDLIHDMQAFADFAPQVVDRETLLAIDAQLNQDAVRTRLKAHYKQMMNPSSAFVAPFIRSDPMGVKTAVLNALEGMVDTRSGHYGIEGGHLVSPDGRHILLFLHTPVTVTDGLESRRLITYLNEQAAQLPDFVAVDMVGAHFHAVSNEDVIKRDITVTLSIAAIGFLLLFLVVFRDFRAAMIFFVPLVAVAMAIPLSALVMGPLSYFMIGMGAVVAGISVDYGIHVYVAVVRHRGDARAAALIVRPLMIGALTTIGIFASFLISDVRGYHQFAVFAISSIVICLILALLLFPHFLTRAHGPIALSYRTAKARAEGWVTDSLIIGIWLIVLVLSLVAATGLKFDSDIRQFDGSHESILNAEDRFNEIWGGGTQMGVLVVQGDTREAALRSTEDIVAQARSLANVKVSSLIDVWPSRATRLQNAGHWAEFWKDGREAKLRQLLAQIGKEFNFSSAAFDPFFDTLYAKLNVDESPAGLPVFDRILERYVRHGDGDVRVFSFFRDTPENRRAIAGLCRGRPDAFCVSRPGLAESLNRAIASEISLLATVAAILIPLLTLALLRKLRLSLLALIPVVTSLAIVLGVLRISALSLNAPIIIAGLVVLGLSIDYGIFMVYAYHFRLRTGTPMAVSLSAGTTLIGAGVLVFAQHPLLFFIGVTLVSGVGSGFVAAKYVIPALYRSTDRMMRKAS